MGAVLTSSSSHLFLLRPPPILSLLFTKPSTRLSLYSTRLSLYSTRLSLYSTQFAIETDINSQTQQETVLPERVLETAKVPKRDANWVKLPTLSVKEKKEIGSYAHSLGKKLKSQQVGKGGVTEAVGVALVESLEKNELLKIKIHNNCPGEIDDNVKRLEELTGSVVVGQIGRTVILYRPSMTKLKAEEKKKHALAVVSRRRQAFKSSSENKGLVPKEYGRGRRGSSRHSNPS